MTVGSKYLSPSVPLHQNGRLGTTKMESLTTLLFEVSEHVAYITLNRPTKANAVSLELAQELEEVVRECDEGESVRAVLLTGAGRIFCGGGDKSFAAQEPTHVPTHLKRVNLFLHSAIQRFVRMRAPVVVAVNGPAAGYGMSLACTGDIVLANESARFTMDYSRVGLTPGASTTYYLPRIIAAAGQGGSLPGRCGLRQAGALRGAGRTDGEVRDPPSCERQPAAEHYGVVDPAGGTAELQAGGAVQKLSLSGRQLEAGAAGGGEGRVPLRGVVPPRGLHRDQSWDFKPGGGALLQQARHGGTMDQGRQAGGRADAAFLSPLSRQRGAAVAEPDRLQPGESVAEAGAAEED